MRRAWRAALAFVAAFAFAHGIGRADPFVPADDAQVLESGLPTVDPRMRELRRLAAELAAAPDNLPLAMRLAGRQLAMGMAEADPRFVGYAQATLAHWWSDASASPALRVLRARIMQARHEFAAAAAELHAALADEPDSAEALLALATGDEVLGKLSEAGEACARLSAVQPGAVAVACTASIASLTGHGEDAFARLSDAIARLPTRDRGQLLWAMTILGEIAIRRGDAAAAEQALDGALRLDSRNIYALTVYADFLLDQDRAADVMRLLSGFERVDALYLRLALAARALDQPKAAAYRDDLRARFDAAQRQGDLLHLRDASRFYLEIAHEPGRALDYARQNWEGHKTPDDARALVAAAAACHDPIAAQPVIDWIAVTHLEDVRMQAPLARLETGG